MADSPPFSSMDDAGSPTGAGGGLGLPPSLRPQGDSNESFDLSSLPRLSPPMEDEDLDGVRPKGPAVGPASKPDKKGKIRALVLFSLALLFIGGLSAAWYMASTGFDPMKTVFGASEDGGSGGIFKPIPGKDDPADHKDVNDDEAHDEGDIAPPQLETYVAGQLGSGQPPQAQNTESGTETGPPATDNVPPKNTPVQTTAGTGQADGSSGSLGAGTPPGPAQTQPPSVPATSALPVQGTQPLPVQPPQGGTPTGLPQASFDGTTGPAKGAQTGPVSRSILSAQMIGPKPDIPDVPLEGGSRPLRMPRYGDLLPVSPDALPLPKAPFDGLTEVTEKGFLPVVSPTGQTPWQAYSRPFSGPPRAPKVAIVITGLGQKTADMEAAIGSLPADITLAFHPYGTDVGSWMQKARDKGHETMIEMNVEPAPGGLIDPGPLALLSTLDAAENLNRLRSQLAAGTGYVGLIAPYPSRFTDSGASLRPILQELRTRGLIYIHSGNIAAINDNADVSPPVNLVTSVLDTPPFQRAIDLRLQALEQMATNNGYAIGVMRASPLTLTRLKAWIDEARPRGVEIVPVSAVVLAP